MVESRQDELCEGTFRRLDREGLQLAELGAEVEKARFLPQQCQFRGLLGYSNRCHFGSGRSGQNGQRGERHCQTLEETHGRSFLKIGPQRAGIGRNTEE